MDVSSGNGHYLGEKPPAVFAFFVAISGLSDQVSGVFLLDLGKRTRRRTRPGQRQGEGQGLANDKARILADYATIFR